jgi:hypothetical protein
LIFLTGLKIRNKKLKENPSIGSWVIPREMRDEWKDMMDIRTEF